MCDTVGKIVNEHYAIFGKNSDRAVNEPQVVEYYPAKDYPKGAKVKCTYIEIDQAQHTNAIVLSRPTWLWGGEIGVNEYGVAIGNEAVFTKGKYGKNSLVGMDLLRLGLERGNSAKQSVDVIIALLQKYNQGGNCGFDSDFHYDNSFLIMDRHEIYVLETVDKDYAVKKYERASISNCLCLKNDADIYKNGKCNFTSKYSDIIMTMGAAGNKRRDLTLNHDLNSLEDMIAILSCHQPKVDVFKKGSVASVCMHASNALTADQTTMSMIVELKDDDIIIWITGSSLPCVSLYKPMHFGKNGLIFDYALDNDTYWKEHEVFNRKLLNAIIPDEFYKDRQSTQKAIIKLANGAPDDDAIQKSMQLDKQFFDRWRFYTFDKKKPSLIYKNFWKKKNKLFFG